MTTFSTELDGKIVVIVVKEDLLNGKQEFMIKENGVWKETTPGKAFSVLRKALEQGNTIEWVHDEYQLEGGDYVEMIEPITSLEKLLEVWYV